MENSHNNLKTIDFKLVKEWNFKKNGKLKPTQVHIAMRYAEKVFGKDFPPY